VAGSALAESPLAPCGFGELVDEFLRGRSLNTINAYRRDLCDFAAFLGAASIDDAARELLSHGHGAANRLVLRYKNTLLERAVRPRWPHLAANPTPGASAAAMAIRLAPATVARRLASVRSLVTLARLLGMVEWTVDVASPKVERVRDVRGPRLDGVRAIKLTLKSRADPKGLRDTAILRLAYDLGLRRAEVCELDLEHFDAASGTISILGKGRRGRERLTVPVPTKAALAAWIEARGHGQGPLFPSMDPARKGNGRLTPNGLYSVIRGAGEQAAVRARPHGLRHSAISAAMDAFGGDLRKVAKFSRHKDWRTLAAYYDEWKDEAGEVAGKVAEGM